jgi:uncharacterized protein (TIGR03435 family)
MKITTGLLAACIAVVSATGFAQQTGSGDKPLAFEAASIKPNASGDWRRAMGPAPGGRFTATNVPARDLIAYAYGISQDSASFRIVGSPKWIDEDRFDVNAVVTGAWTPAQMREMMRTLMADRFRLAAHAETRELPTYTLAVVPNRPRLLRRSVVDEAACQARREAIQRREPVPPPVPGAPPICGNGRAIPGTITAVGGSMTSLASTLGQFLSRSVVDRTELSGLFDFELKWTPDTPPLAPPDAPPLNIDPNGPSIFTALQEQLGLRLESARDPVDVVVIERVEHPTPD